jgi:hypothetical protein
VYVASRRALVSNGWTVTLIDRVWLSS